MDVTLILKIAGVGLLVSVASQILNKSGKDELSSMLSVAGIIVVMLLLVGEVGDLFSKVREIFSI